jgi:demethylspheroidene O-methyltransferase
MISAAHKRLIDVGGGEGAFLAQPWPSGIPGSLSLFDLPPVADRARIRFASQPLASARTAHGGSFLDDPLPRGHDCVTLVRVLFDHEDTVVCGCCAMSAPRWSLDKPW